MKIVIELITEKTRQYWNVSQGEKSAIDLTYHEMIGLVTELTVPLEKRCLQWMKTKQQHEQWKQHLEDMMKRNNP